MSADAAERDILDSGEAGGRAIRGGALRTGAYFTAMLLSLISVPFMTRHLGTVDYGYYVTATSYLFILAGITEAGLTQLGMREFSVRTGEERERFLRNLVGLRLTLTVVGIAAGVLFTFVAGSQGVVVLGIAILGLGSLLSLTQQTYQVTLAARLQFGWISVLELIRQATLSGAIIALVAVGAGLVPFFFASVLSGTAILVVTLALLRQEAAIAPLADLQAWKRMVVEVLPYAAASAVGLIYFRLAVIVMSFIASDHETGIYSAAVRIIETIGVIPWMLVSGAFPILARAARDDAARLRYGLGRLFDVSLLLGLLLCGGMAIGAPFAVEVVAGPQFDASVPVLRLLSLTTVSSFLVATWSFGLLSLGRYSSLLRCNLLAVAVAAVLCGVLIPSMGAEGGALATFGAEMALAIAYLAALARHDRGLLPDPATIARLVPAAVGMALVGLFVPVAPLPRSILGGIVFLALAFATRAVPPELIAAIRRRPPGDPQSTAS